MEQSFRDDAESLCYELLTGSLPWDEEDESLWPHLRELAPSFSSED
jgi:hypothetical protein